MGKREHFQSSLEHFLESRVCFLVTRERFLGANYFQLGARKNILCPWESLQGAKRQFRVYY